MKNIDADEFIDALTTGDASVRHKAYVYHFSGLVYHPGRKTYRVSIEKYKWTKEPFSEFMELVYSYESDDTQDPHHGRTAIHADQHQARNRVHQRLQNRHTDQNPVPILKPLPPRPVRKRRTQQRFQKHQQNHGFRQI